MCNGFDELKKNIIEPGLCVACGQCAGICPEKAIIMDYGESPYYDQEPVPKKVSECNKDCDLCYILCPAKSIPILSMEKLLFNRKRNNSENEQMLGVYKECLAAHAVNSEIRSAGGSGGVVTSLLTYALDKKLIDGAIIASMSSAYPWRAFPAIATNKRELLKGAGHKPFVVSNSELLNSAVERGLERIAFVGLPCQIHGIRKMQLNKGKNKIIDNILSKIAFTIGIFCKSQLYYKSVKHILTELGGIDDLQEVVSLNFNSGDTMPKNIEARCFDGKVFKVDPMTYYQWTAGIHTRDRCVMCIDWAAEVADISIGDLWEPWILKDNKGWSSLIVRTQKGEHLVHNAENDVYLKSRPTPVEYLVGSLGCETAKYANAERLYWRKNHSGWPVPDYEYIPDFMKPRSYNSKPWRIKPKISGLF